MTQLTSIESTKPWPYGTLKELRKTIMSQGLFDSGAKYATLHFYTDAHAYEIIGWTASGKSIQARRLDAKQVAKMTFTPGGFAGHTDNTEQRWEYTSNPDNDVKTFRLTKKGWAYKGQKVTIRNTPSEWYDFNY